MDKSEIILRIGQLRNRVNLSARELSLRIFMNAGYINRLESKRDFLPSLEVLLKIIEACNSTPAEFFSDNLDTYRQDKQLLDSLNGLDKDKKATLIQFLKK